MTPDMPFDRAVRVGVGIGVFISAAGSLAVMLSWATGHWMAGTLGSGYVPMAPSTALAVFALNLSVLLSLHLRGGRFLVLLGWASVLLAVASSALSLALPFLDGSTLLTVWLSPVNMEIGGVPAGVMSPLTAAVLLLFALSLALELPPLGRRLTARQAASLLATAGTAASAVVLYGYLLDTPLLYGTRTVPMALPTGIALLLLGTGLIFKSAPGTWPMSLLLPDHAAEPAAWPARGPFAALLLLFAVIVATGGFYLRTQMSNMREAARAELNAVADLKTQQILRWREERMGDARFFARAAFVARDVRALLEHPGDGAAQAEALNWLTSLEGGGRYVSAAIADAEGNSLLSVPPGEESAEEPRFRALIAETVRKNDILMTDLHAGSDGGVHLDLMVPVHDSGGEAVPGRPIAVIALRMDPANFLFPLIQSWPSRSPTAETLLVRREEGEVVFLNRLRHGQAAPMDLRLPVDSPDLPAAMAARGASGIMEGRDYRGVPVVAVAHRVPNSEWHLLAKVDKAEIYAASWRQALHVAGVIALLLLSGALFILAIWRQRNLEYYRERLEEEHQRTMLAQRFEHLMRQASDLILITDPDGRIVEANDRAVQEYGLSLGELRGTELAGLRAKAAQPAFGAQMRELEEQSETVFETEHRRADGTEFPVEVSARLVDIGGAQHRLFIVRDISERREREREIDRLNRMYAALSRVNQAIVRSQTEAELLAQVCGALVDEAGFRIAWTGRYEPETGVVRQRTWRCDLCLDLPETEFLTDGGDMGQGPTIAAAVREDRVVVCRDLSASPSSPDVRLRIDTIGIAAAAAFPIHLHDEVWGVLAVGAADAACLGDREMELLEEAAQDLSFALEHLAGESERRHAADELRRSEENMALAEKIAHVGYWERSLSGDTILWSDEAYRVFGLAPQERGMDLPSFLGMVHPEDRDAVAEAIRATREEDRPYNIEFRAVLPDGAVRFVHSQGELFLDSAGRPERMFGTMLDITNRKRVEQALRESERRFRVIAENTGDVIWRLDAATQQFTYISPSIFRLRGFTPEEAMSQDIRNSLTPESYEKLSWHILERVAAFKAGDESARIMMQEVCQPHKNGSILTTEVVSTLIANEEGTITEILGVTRDITARKRAESLLKAHSDRLERMVDERTRLLREAQDELVRNEKLAVLGQLAGGIGHELRNPLGVISNAVYFLNLTGAAKDETCRDYLNIISAEVHTSQKIISDLLGFARTSRAEGASVNLPALVGEVLSGVSPAEGVETALDFPENLPPVWADPGHARQVLTNLIMNACQAMPNGGVLTVGARREGARVRIGIADTGCGMSAQEQSRIFEPLYSTKARGIGLGLSVTRNLVEANAGSIEVTSEPGKGSTFSVLLPAKE